MLLRRLAWTLVTIVLCPFFGLYYFASGGIKELVEFAKDNIRDLKELWSGTERRTDYDVQ